MTDFEILLPIFSIEAKRQAFCFLLGCVVGGIIWLTNKQDPGP